MAGRVPPGILQVEASHLETLAGRFFTIFDQQ